MPPILLCHISVMFSVMSHLFCHDRISAHNKPAYSAYEKITTYKFVGKIGEVKTQYLGHPMSRYYRNFKTSDVQKFYFTKGF